MRISVRQSHASGQKQLAPTCRLCTARQSHTYLPLRTDEVHTTRYISTFTHHAINYTQENLRLTMLLTLLLLLGMLYPGEHQLRSAPPHRQEQRPNTVPISKCKTPHTNNYRRSYLLQKQSSMRSSSSTTTWHDTYGQ